MVVVVEDVVVVVEDAVGVVGGVVVVVVEVSSSARNTSGTRLHQVILSSRDTRWVRRFNFCAFRR